MGRRASAAFGSGYRVSFDLDGAIEHLHRFHLRRPRLLQHQQQMPIARRLGLEAPHRLPRRTYQAGVFGIGVDLGAQHPQHAGGRVLHQPAVAGGGVAGQGQGQGLAGGEAQGAVALFGQVDIVRRLLGAGGQQGDAGGQKKAGSGYGALTAV